MIIDILYSGVRAQSCLRQIRSRSERCWSTLTDPGQSAPTRQSAATRQSAPTHQSDDFWKSADLNGGISCESAQPIRKQADAGQPIRWLSNLGKPTIG